VLLRAVRSKKKDSGIEDNVSSDVRMFEDYYKEVSAIRLE
jgi:hypothetical protein